MGLVRINIIVCSPWPGPWTSPRAIANWKVGQQTIGSLPIANCKIGLVPSVCFPLPTY